MKRVSQLLVAACLAGFAFINPADAAPVDWFCNATYWDIPPLGGTLSTPNLADTEGLNLDGNAEDRVWVSIRGLDSGVWVTHLDTDTNDWVNVWTNLGGATISAPRVAYQGGTQLYIRTIGTDNNTYGRSLTPVGWGGWYAVAVGTAAYYGTPGPHSTTVSGFPDRFLELRKNGNQPEYRCS